jgi:hypothetical protein
MGYLLNVLRRPQAISAEGFALLLILEGVRGDRCQAEVEVRLVKSLEVDVVTLESLDDGLKSFLVRNSDEH